MISASLKKLVRTAASSGRLVPATVWGIISAVAVPLLFLIVGDVVHVLIGDDQSPPARIAQWLTRIDMFLPGPLTPLAKVSALLGIAMGLIVVLALSLVFFYRQVQAVAVDFETSIIEALRAHSKKLAVVRTLSAQQTALVDGLEYHLPRVRTSLTRWWRTFPRHLVQLLGCLVIAFLLQPLLSLLTVIGAAIVSLVYRLVDGSKRAALPVVRERATQRRGELMQLSLKGPLLESVHAEQEINKRFHEQLVSYRKEAFQSLASSTWKTPLIILIAGGLGCLFLFVTAVQILRPESPFSIADAVTFLLAGCGAAVSAVRLQRSAREIKSIDTAADELVHFLNLPVEQFAGTDLKTIERVARQAELEHVTLQDSSGRKLLENVSVVFKPGRLIGVVASQRLQAQALVELLMGYGRPVSGRMLVDGDLISDLRPDSLSRCSLWVSPDGPLVTGTVQDNLHPSGANGTLDYNDALRAARAIDLVQQLPDGIATLITPDDDRLAADAAFRLGIARANLRSPSIVVVEEPESHVDAKIEQETVDAIRSLVKHSSISVVLPHRLMTVRQCDLVILVHDHKIADMGTHAELLQRSELYRHLNYVRFNAFRNLAV